MSRTSGIMDTTTSQQTQSVAAIELADMILPTDDDKLCFLMSKIRSLERIIEHKDLQINNINVEFEFVQEKLHRSDQAWNKLLSERNALVDILTKMKKESLTLQAQAQEAIKSVVPELISQMSTVIKHDESFKRDIVEYVKSITQEHLNATSTEEFFRQNNAVNNGWVLKNDPCVNQVKDSVDQLSQDRAVGDWGHKVTTTKNTEEWDPCNWKPASVRDEFDEASFISEESTGVKDGGDDSWTNINAATDLVYAEDTFDKHESWCTTVCLSNMTANCTCGASLVMAEQRPDDKKDPNGERCGRWNCSGCMDCSYDHSDTEAPTTTTTTATVQADKSSDEKRTIISSRCRDHGVAGRAGDNFCGTCGGMNYHEYAAEGSQW